MSTAVGQRLTGSGSLGDLTKSGNENDVATLPEVRPRSSQMQLDTMQPLPTSLQSDFIPADVLFALTQPPAPQKQLGPPSRFRNLNVSNDKSRKKPANVWNFPKRREKFKHLTESTACNCGAGRDISFLYDVPIADAKEPRPDSRDVSLMRYDEPPKRSLQLPDTLIPEEYHVVKNKGVIGLEYHDSKYTTATDDHENHLVVFPSMKPTSRYEVMQLKETLDKMLTDLGINNLDIEVKGPTQMHNLLELIKKEQNIYNTVFHELIRQTSVECIERGELLSDLRNKYSDLLSKVPKQIKSLHEEVMAQRALDRRLTEELLRFKSTITILTDELTEVKEHDRIVTKQAAEAQEDLKAALTESQKNSGLLSEYHDLYELQRQRLEKQVNLLTAEKELWSTAAYSLALKVTEEHQLNTANRLHVSEKAWCKLAGHFAILLSDQDTGVLTILQGNVETWRELTADFNQEIKTREMEMKDTLKIIKGGIQHWVERFHNEFMNKDGQMTNPPDIDRTSNLLGDIRAWEKHLAREMEKFGGESVLSMQDMLGHVVSEMQQWTECAIKVFARHHREGQSEDNHPHLSPMHKMNGNIEDLVNQFNVRLMGENGSAKEIIHLMNNLETWNNKLNLVLHGSTQLKDHQWLQFYQLLDDWTGSIEKTLMVIGATQKEEDKEKGLPHETVDVANIFKMTQKWMTSATNAVDSEDAKLVEEVTTLHTEMVKWMVQMLLRLAPDRESNSREAHQMSLLGSTSLAALKANAKALCERLDNFSTYVTQCCLAIVSVTMQRKMDLMEDNADHEMRDLKRFKTECNEWINTASLLLQELTGDQIEFEPTASTIILPSIPVTPATTTPGVTGMTPQIPVTPGASRTPQVPQTPPSTQQAFTDKETLSREDTNMSQATIQNTEAESKDLTHQDDMLISTETQPSVEIEPDTQTLDISIITPEQGVTDNIQLEDTSSTQTPATEKRVTISEEPAEIVEAIGRDESTHPMVLGKASESKPPVDGTVFDSRPDTPNTKKAYEALAAVSTLQIQLLETEERAQKAEDKILTVEDELKKTQELMRSLERKLAALTGEAPDEGTQDKEKPDAKPEDKAKEKTPEQETSDGKTSRTGSAKKDDKNVTKITMPTPPTTQAPDIKRSDSRPGSRAGSRTGQRTKKK